MSATVHLIFGKDEYLVSARAREIVDGLIPADEQTLGVEVIDGRGDTIDAAVSALNSCREALKTISFFGSSKVIWFRDVTFLTDTTVGRSEVVKEKVNDLASIIKEGPLPGQTLVITAAQVDKRYAFFKACKAGGEICEFAIPEKGYLMERQAAERLGQCLAEAGLKMPGDIRNAFLERVGTDTRQMANELEKLAVFMGDRKDVLLADIDAVTSSSRDSLAWDLADAVGKREPGRALEVLRRLLFQKESAIGLIMVMESRVRELMIYREAVDRGWLKRGRGSAMEWGEVPPEMDTVYKDDFARDPRSTHPFRAGLLAGQARLFSMRELKVFLMALVEAHTRLVTSSVPPAMILELLLLHSLPRS